MLGGHCLDDLLEVQSIGKSFGAVEVLRNLSFRTSPGEFVSIVGPSGCGKTTLLQLMAGLTASDAGKVLFRGAALEQRTPEGVSIVFQDYSRSLFPWLRNLDNVVFGMRRRTGLKSSEHRDVAAELLVSVGLKGFENHYPWQLSGGMQQRVAIARSLAADPALLLLDEPLAAVDAQTRADIQDLLLDIARRTSRTCILVTHDVDEAIYMADRVVVLSNRPTCVLEDIATPLGNQRDQIVTRESTEFLEIRHRVLSRIRELRRQAVAAS